MSAHTKKETAASFRRGGCFACVNSGRGFVSYFDSLFEGIDFIFVVKGGPGTGKSGLMAHIADVFEARGEETLRIYCSSDPDSLDGLILPVRKIALTDGTSPHARDLHTPGVDGIFLDTGRFLDVLKLRENAREIARQNALKSAGFKRGYLLLAGAKELMEAAESLILPALDEKRLLLAVRRCLPQAGGAQAPSRVLPLRSVGMKGEVCLDTQIVKAERILTLSPFCGLDLYFLEELRREADARKIFYERSPDPVTLRPESLYFPCARLLVRSGEALGKENEKVLSLRRLLSSGKIPKDDRARAKALTRQAEVLYGEAKEAFVSASAPHFALEKIYGEAMDYAGVEDLKKKAEKTILYLS